MAGWHGQETADPRKFAALRREKAKQIARDAEDEEALAVENGEIVNDGQGAYLTTDKDYGDIELFVDFKIVPKADSGVYLRGTPQVQIWDYTEPSYASIGADKGSGGLWNNSPGARQRPAGAGGQAVRRVEHVPGHPGRRADPSA